MGTPIWLKVTVLIVFVSCCSIWLSVTIITGFHRNIRSMDLLSFVPFGAFPHQSISRISLKKSNREISSEYSYSANSARKNHLESFINDSLPWLHFYASSPKILTNYFLHGYHQGYRKYHKKYRHSRMVILPFLIDKEDELSNCLTYVSWHQGMAVSYHHSMHDRWHWENSNKGLAKFKRKYNVFYGHSSIGICSRNFLGSMAPDSEVRSGSFSKYSAGTKSAQAKEKKKHFKETSINQSQTISDQKADSMNCGQILLLQHPVYWAIEEYYRTFPGKVSCDDVSKFNVSPGEDADDDSLIDEENGINSDDIIRWIKTRGNIIFQHLMFHPELCAQNVFLNYSIVNRTYNSQEKNQTENYLNNNSFTNININDTSENSKETGERLLFDERDTIHYNMENSCERNMKLYLENLKVDEKNFLVNYITENLPSWFSLVGLYEDLQDSLQMLDIVHHFPLHSCISHDSKDRVSLSSASGNSDSNHYRKTHENTVTNSFIPEEQTGNNNGKIPESQSSESLHSDFLRFESEFSRNTVDVQRFSKTPEVFQDLKAESYTEDEVLQNNGTMTTGRIYEQDKHFKSLRSNDERYVVDNKITKGFLGNQNERTFKENYANVKRRWKVCNGVYDLQQLFHRLNNNADVQKSLALDLTIYKAVKRLYQYQKQIVFNILKV